MKQWHNWIRPRITQVDLGWLSLTSRCGLGLAGGGQLVTIGRVVPAPIALIAAGLFTAGQVSSQEQSHSNAHRI